MNDLKVFENSEFGQVRIVIIDGDPWFVAKDFCETLGYVWNGLQRIAHVPEEWRGVTSVVTPSGIQEMHILSEQGLYFFLGRSDKPKALPYQKWVAGEIMPSIRRTGGYIAAPDNATPEEILARAVLVADDTIKRLKEKTAALESKVEADRPKVIFADAVDASKTSILVGEFATLLRQNGVNIGQNRLFEYLRESGWLNKTGDRRNLPTQKAADMGLFEIKERTVNNPDGSIRVTRTSKLTGKGQVYFINKFLNEAAGREV